MLWVTTVDLTKTINGLGGNLQINCDPPSGGVASCSFVQDILKALFGANGLSLSGCSFGECVQNAVVSGSSNSTTTATNSSAPLSGGVIAGLAVVGSLVFLALLGFAWGWIVQRKAKAAGGSGLGGGVTAAERKLGVGIEWNNVGYVIRNPGTNKGRRALGIKSGSDFDDGKVILNGVRGRVVPGQMLAILGPSGAGKSTLVELLAAKNKDGLATGTLRFFTPTGGAPAQKPRVGFVDQSDILPPTLTVREALMFAARLRLPESVSEANKTARVFEVMNQLGIADLADTRIGGTNGQGRGVSGGEMRRISIGLELVGRPEILILDEPTSGLDSVSALKVATVLQQLARDPDNPTTVIASIHQPSSQLYRIFDQVLVMSNGRPLYSGAGGVTPSEYFASRGHPCPQLYNVADHLLDLASNPPANFTFPPIRKSSPDDSSTATEEPASEKLAVQNPESETLSSGVPRKGSLFGGMRYGKLTSSHSSSTGYATTFLTQLE
ncbi:hypothetical protein FRB99_007722, partial [Tulasnella sp. 403]